MFEYWLHAACLIPLTEYRYRLPVMRRASDGSSKWWKHWLSQPGNAELLAQVRERVRTEGPLRGADFEHDSPRHGSWWNWKPAKLALERLYDQGEVIIAGRVNFQRLHDMRERVLPKWVDVSEPSADEMHRHTLAWAARAGHLRAGAGVRRPAHHQSHHGQTLPPTVAEGGHSDASVGENG